MSELLPDRVRVWRDVDSSRARIGILIGRYGLSLYVGRRLYRLHWGES